MSSPTPSAAEVRLQFFLSADGALAGAHTLGRTEHGLPELVLPITGDPAQPGWTLTVSEVHDLLRSLSADLPNAASFAVPLEADGSVLTLTPTGPLAPSATDLTRNAEALAAVPEVQVMAWSTTPGPSPRGFDDERVLETAGVVNGLRLSTGLAPVPESELDFSTTAEFSVATPMVQALGEAVSTMDASQLVAWHLGWMELVDGGYRSDVALATGEALAGRTGRQSAWIALGQHADEVAKSVLGSDGPSELLMETCVQLFEQVGVDDDETRQILLGRIAVMLHDQIRVLLLIPLVEDVVGAEISVPPLQAWWSGQTRSHLQADDAS